MIYHKYEFDQLPDELQPTEERPHSIDNADVVILGHLVQQEGEYDEEGSEITPPVISDKIAVDILYHGEPIEDWEEHRVFPKKPKHTIAGQMKAYEDSTNKA